MSNYHSTGVLCTTLIMTIVALARCSIFESPAATVVDLPYKLEGQWTVVDREQEPHIYVHSFTNPQGGQSDIFLGIVEECRNDQKTPLSTTLRQLLVGFDDIKLGTREQLTFQNTHVLRTEIEATLEKRTLTLISYSFRTSTCIVDMVFWAPQQDDGPNELSLFARHAPSIVSTVEEYIRQRG